MLDHFGQKRRQFIYYFKSKASKRLAPIKNCLVLRYLLRVLESGPQVKMRITALMVTFALFCGLNFLSVTSSLA